MSPRLMGRCLFIAALGLVTCGALAQQTVHSVRAGAFETAAEAQAVADSLRAAGSENVNVVNRGAGTAPHEVLVGESLTQGEAWAAAQRMAGASVASREVASSDFLGVRLPDEECIFEPRAVADIWPDQYLRLNHHAFDHAEAERAATRTARPTDRPQRGLRRLLEVTGADQVDSQTVEALRGAGPVGLSEADLWALSASYRMRVDRAEAMSAWQEAADRGGDSAPGLYARARLAGWIQADGRREEARAIWEDLLANHPGTEAAGFAQYRLAYLDTATGREAQAIERWLEVIEGVHPLSDEERLDAMLRVGAMHHRLGNRTDSLLAYRQLQGLSTRPDARAAVGLECLGLIMELKIHDDIGSYEEVLAEYDRLQSLGPLEPYVACRADLMRQECNFYLGNSETALSQIAEFRTRHDFETFRREHLAADKFEAMALLRLGRADEADAAFAALRERYTQEDALAGTDPRALALLYRARICLERDSIDLEGAEAFLEQFEQEHADSMHADLAEDLRATVMRMHGLPIPTPGLAVGP